jgi:hypothetical protein
MTSSDSKSDPKSNPNAQNDGGGMLPALLAGAGILAVAALFIFGGDDEKEAKQAKQAKDAAAQQANAQTAGGSSIGGVASREADDATPNPRPKPRLNPRIADAIVTEGMAPVPNKKPEPTSWASTDEEIAYWEAELVDANRMLALRQQASERVPAGEERIRQNGTPEELAQYQARKQVVAENLAKAQARVDEIEGKLSKLRG